MEAVEGQIGIGLCETFIALVGPLTVQAKARGPATIGRIDGTKSGNQALVDGPLRDLIRCVPVVGVSCKSKRESRWAARQRILEDPIEFSHVLIMIPGAIIKIRLKVIA